MKSRPLALFFFLLLAASLLPAPADAALAKRAGTSSADACNPHPDDKDIILPMPDGLSMAFRLVAVPSKGLLWDMAARPGRDDAANSDRAFYDRRYRAFLSAPFSRADLPASWRAQAPAGDYFFYLVAKYEVSRLQWQSIMGRDSAGSDANMARPVTDISWYEAVEFTRRYTEWLLQHAADALPRFAGDSRNVGFVRLPTETEWEYAARGGQTAGPEQLTEKDFFALPAGAPLTDYAVYRPEGTARIAEDCAPIGSRKPNPLGLYDTAGNAAEMALDMFRFSVGGRLHGSAGGFVRKGGSFRSGEAEIMPGRREESAFFLADGPAHARDLGFRPVISGINTPGGDRPSALQQAWNAAGQSNPLARDASRNPLEELDRLIAAAPDDNSRKNLLTLREAIKENNILQEQQQQLEMQSTLRTAVYMLETIRNYASRRNSLQSQYDSMKRDSRTAKGETLATLRRIMKTAEQGLEQFQTGIDRSLSFYRTRVEEAARLDKEDFDRALAALLKDYAGDDLFNENMRRNADLLRKHVQTARTGKLPPDTALLQEILKARTK
ncbi:SUMF1/EgtB/PvdO family nonheme iron enzyme [uncultured Desulfovibrio sp.]|uniref:formylglycine-generating enzyme family protein n=1 Tax=uncultured Desulfovibrio sp. TaxID=167968 RepID=UPI00261D9CC5|nr:SUMF1/EgtB/PvdO family nonheme iron enzyme [uncultured Desulfovibrio sp.]